MSDTATLQLHDVSFAYHRGVDVVRGVTASLEPGKLHFMLGPNGAGKSTLLRLMLGQLAPGGGRVTLDGRSVHRVRADRLARSVAYVPQRSQAAFAFSVAEVVAMGRYAVGRDAGVERGAIEACDLAELADRPFVELSVGQQQRVMLARAMAQAAGGGRVLLLDEPTSAMDLAHVHRTMRRVRDLAHDDALAVLVVAQDINLAARYADRVWLMSDGRLVGDDAWESVLEPQRLGEVYGVTIRAVRHDDADSRPLFEVTDAPADDPRIIRAL